MKKGIALLCTGISLLSAPTSIAAYSFVGTIGPLSIATIYQNEYGSAFITFPTAIDSDCAGGMYLMNLQQAESTLQKYKMSIAISAKVSGKRVHVDYFKDPSRPYGWDRCFIHGITLVD